MLIVGVDTYVTLEEVNSYLLDYGTPKQLSIWSNEPVNVQEKHLRRSAMEMNSLAYAGRKCDPEQVLAFPRFLTHTCANPKVPEAIKMAQIENAVALADPTALEDSEFYKRLRMFGIASYSLGSMSETLVQGNGVSVNDSANKIRAGTLTSPTASLLVQPFLVTGVDIR